MKNDWAIAHVNKANANSALIVFLEAVFPWLRDPDAEDISGSDTIMDLQNVYDELKK